MNTVLETPTGRPPLRTTGKSTAIRQTLLPLMQELDCNLEFPDYLKALPGVTDEVTIRTKRAGKPVTRLNYVQLVDEDRDTFTVLFDSSEGIPNTLHVLAMPVKEVSWRYDYDAQTLV